MGSNIGAVLMSLKGYIRREVNRLVGAQTSGLMKRPGCANIGVVTDISTFVSSGKVTVILEDGSIREAVVRGHKAIGVGTTVHLVNGVIV